MKHFLTILFVLVCMAGIGQEKYVKARVMLDEAELRSLAKFGVDIHEGFYKKGYSFETDFSSSEIEKIIEAGFEVEILVEDVGAYYRDRSAQQKDLQIDRSSYTYWQVPQNWEYGSMAGFYTLDEALAELDSMYALYPNIISERKPISEDTLSWEGRELWWLKISDNPDVDEDEPELLYTSLHHAREVISLQQQIFYMWYLLENYESDPEIKYLVDNTEMYFVPIINADGFQYNCTTNPDGGGMWRKNRRDNNDGSFGVDPNRNYGYNWGLNDQGSSPNPTDATYRGPAPFSEPEIKNMRDLCNAHDFRITLNYHSHGNLLLSPWGYTAELPVDSTLLLDFSKLMVRENNYTYGPGSTTIYPTNGASDDWMYGEQTTKDKIFSYTPEVGGSSDGHWAVMQRIIPLCQEQMWQNITAARLVGKYAIANDISPLILSETSGYMSFEIKRMGLVDTDVFTVSILPLDDYITGVGDPVEFVNMELLELDSDSISYILDNGIENGTVFKFLLQVNNGDITYADTITKIFGEELILFYDDCETMDNWTSVDWDTTSENYYSPNHSITDSPGEDYEDGSTSLIAIDTIIDLANVEMAFLKFQATWDIEEGYDYAQVLISSADNTDWKSLEGKYTSVGTNYQDPGQPVYDGTHDWVMDEFDISEYAGEKVKFRFWLRSDNYVNGDGFYFDEFTVSAISDDITSIETGIYPQTGVYVSDAFPNPTDTYFKVQYELEQNNNARFELFDAVGKLLIVQPLSDIKGVLKITTHDFQKGVYTFRIVNGNKYSETKKLILR